ncbi:hypothetical protein [Aeromonas phage JELG-KS1]|uniref:Uncharacterized protein n=1 Tax=Aeromonas phage JELG-KS1 TaxID=2951233 RepID=A0A9E7NP67_9CAUD|nr:hypothetical protein [Aeromonas phage JELG-KS1]
MVKYNIKRLVAQLRLNGNLEVSMYELSDGRWLVGYGHHEVITVTPELAAIEFNSCTTHAMTASAIIEPEDD